MTPNAVMTGHYSPALVLLSVLIAILSAYAALDLAGRVATSRSPRARIAWLGGGAVAMGMGIWSMHYVGMLAFRLPMRMLYDWPTVALSMVAAIIASAIALSIVARERMNWKATILGSLAMGTAIAGMHYIGMAAMRMPGMVTYSRPLVTISVVLAIVIAFVALRLSFAARHITRGWTWSKALSALLMGLAIPAMHYTGMAAATFSRSATAAPDMQHAIGISDLGTVSIAFVTIVMLCLVFLAVAIDRRFTTHSLQMEDSEERYRRIISSAFDAFIAFTPEGMITDWNTQAMTTFGWSAEEALGRSIEEMLHLPEEPSCSGKKSTPFMSTCIVSQGRMEIKARHKTGMLFPVEMALSAIHVGEIKLFAAFVHDVTERKLIEQHMEEARASAEAANRAKSEFLANMSHEIRTPLNGVIGMTDLALTTELTREQREYLETVKLSADSLLGVINDILDFSKIEAGKIELEEIGVDLQECVETALKTLALRADEKGLELLCEIDPDVPSLISGDSGRLRQILTNLVGNAIKFTDEGEVSVTVRAERNEATGPHLHFTIEDTGIGIPQEKVERIFESFAQADTSTTRQYGGTGLGLTISRRLIEIMGGRIWVESEVGRGSRFHFTIPLKEAAALPSSLDSLPVHKDLAGVKVLIIDDNKTNRRILKGLLSRWGMEPTTASNGEEALWELNDAAKSGSPFRLVLTDMHMPKMDGFMVVQEMQKNTRLAPSTVMMLSSGGNRGDAARCQELGVAAYLLKPVRHAELQEAIARALGINYPEPKSMITQQSLQAERPSAEFLNILLAEDNEVNQKLAVRLLEKRGHAVTVVGNGRQAVQALNSQSFDLVLMDIQMPEMDGIEATKAVREREKQTGGHQPIVAMTALVMKGDRERCLAAQMDGYLSKPIRPQEIDAVLESYVYRKTAAAAQPDPQTEPAAAPQEETIDRADLLERVDHDVVFIGELTEVLREDCPRKLSSLRDALRMGDAQQAKRIAHGLKGALANLSARRCWAVAAKMEMLAAEGQLSDVEGLVSQLETEISRALEALSSMCKEQTL